VPPEVVTVMSKVPVDNPAGETAVIESALLIVKLVAFKAPKCTAVAPVKLVPVMVTEVPPEGGPVDGLIPVTVGAGGVDETVTVTVTSPESSARTPLSSIPTA